MPLFQGAAPTFRSARLIAYGHSFVTDYYNPYGGSYTWASSPASTDGSRYPELMVSALGVDISRRYIQVDYPAQALAGGAATQPVWIPEEGILEAAWIQPSASITGQATNCRQYTVYYSQAGTFVALCTLLLNSAGNSLTAWQAQVIYDISQGASNSALAIRSGGNVLTTTHPGNTALGAPASGAGVFQNYLLAQSTAFGTGQTGEGGGRWMLRWGGNYRNMGVGGAKLTKSGLYHGGWAAALLGRAPRHTYGPEVNATPGESTSATALRCDALEVPIPSGWKIAMSGGVTATTTSDASVGATTIAVSALSGAVANGEQGVARYPLATGAYTSLTPHGLALLGWGRNDAIVASPDRTAWKESLRAVAALSSAPYLQPADRANIVYTNGSGTWSTWTAPAAGQFMVPWSGVGKGVKRFTGTSTSATAVIHLPPAYDGTPVDLFFLAQAGSTRGGAATITASSAFNGGLACTINTSGVCTGENITAMPGGSTYTISGTTTLTISGGGTWTAGLVDQIGAAIKGTTLSAGVITKGTKIASITSSTVAVLDTAGTNGTVQSVETAGYIPMVKRLVGLTAGANTITISMTGIDATDSSAEFIFMGYGIESTPATPVVVVGAAKSPNDSGDWTDIDNLNTDSQAVIAGTATTSGNSLEPGFANVTYVDIDTPMGLGADLTPWNGDGIHPNGKGHLIHRTAILDRIKRVFTSEQLAAR